MVDVLDIFYNNIIVEAANGTIDCFLVFSMPFSTIIKEENKTYYCTNFNELLVPTLIIENKKELDLLLIEYTLLALEFYNDTNFPQEILDYQMFNDNKICKEKMIMTLLWSNATIDDFKKPNKYLKNRINFLKNNIEEQELGYSNNLDGNINIKIEKDSIYNETPLKASISISNDFETYYFPEIKFGISQNKLYIYAVQSNKENNNNFSKKINRKLYKIGEGFEEALDNYEYFETGNLKDVTPSFIVALNIFIFWIQKYNIEEYLVPNLLIERWNSKIMVLLKKNNFYNYEKDKFDELLNNIEKIQINISEKFIRNFRRLEHHHKSLTITSEPFLVDSFLHFNNTNNIICNNNLLEETAILSNNNYSKKI